MTFMSIGYVVSVLFLVVGVVGYTLTAPRLAKDLETKSPES